MKFQFLSKELLVVDRIWGRESPWAVAKILLEKEKKNKIIQVDRSLWLLYLQCFYTPFLKRAVSCACQAGTVHSAKSQSFYLHKVPHQHFNQRNPPMPATIFPSTTWYFSISISGVTTVSLKVNCISHFRYKFINIFCRQLNLIVL